MNAVISPESRYRRIIRESLPELPGQGLAWLDAQRTVASERFEELGFPTRKQEAWRYTNVGPLLDQSFTPSTGVLSALQEEDIEDLSLPGLDAYRMVFANGRFVGHLSRRAGLPAGAHLMSLYDALSDRPEWVSQRLGRAVDPDHDAFTALNTALVNDGLCLYVEPGCRVDRPIEVLYLGVELEESVLVQPRNLVVLGAGAQATLVERHAGLGQSRYFNNGLSEILLGPEARLTHTRLQEESINAFHISDVFIRQERAGHYDGSTLAFGASWSRSEYHVRFGEPDAECVLNGLYLVGERQLADFHLNVEHGVPGCTSREQFKGILYGAGRAVFDGRVLVEKDAQHTDAQLSNDNLLLTRNAEVDTKPQLEIYADDVKCSHGTTVGELDPLQLFYLRSRGIGETEARKMLCVGFAAEILERIEIAGLRDYAEALLRDRLEGRDDGLGNAPQAAPGSSS